MVWQSVHRGRLGAHPSRRRWPSSPPLHTQHWRTVNRACCSHTPGLQSRGWGNTWLLYSAPSDHPTASGHKPSYPYRPVHNLLCVSRVVQHACAMTAQTIHYHIPPRSRRSDTPAGDQTRHFACSLSAEAGASQWEAAVAASWHSARWSGWQCELEHTVCKRQSASRRLVLLAWPPVTCQEPLKQRHSAVNQGPDTSQDTSTGKNTALTAGLFYGWGRLNTFTGRQLPQGAGQPWRGQGAWLGERGWVSWRGKTNWGREEQLGWRRITLGMEGGSKVVCPT